jgi:peroxiredoxin
MTRIRKFGMAIAVLGLMAAVVGCETSKTPPGEKKSVDVDSKAAVSDKAVEDKTTASTKAAAVGDMAPDWKDLQGIDGKPHALADHKDAKAVVLVFTCNHCPVAKAYESRLVAFQADYKDKGVQLVAVNVNDIPEDRLDKMQERAKEAGFNFPYLFDPTQNIGRDYGATCTPHFFLLDGQRKIAYTGAMDDNMDAEKVQSRHLREAVDAVLAGKTPAQPVTQQKGCGIKWK